MRKIFLFAFGGMFFLLGNGLFAVNSSQSVEYVRTLNRNASTDVDASFFNPAGLAFLKENGLHLQVANQFIYQTKTVEENSTFINAYGKDKYKGDINAYIFPDLHIAYKMDKVALFFNFMPVGGGGKGEFKDGLPMFDNLLLGYAAGVIQQVVSGIEAASPGATTGYQYALNNYSRDLYFQGTEYVFASSIGAAYKLNNTYSIALGYRLSYAYKAYSGYAKNLQVTTDFSGSFADTMLEQGSDAAIAQNWQDVEVDLTATGIGHSLLFGFNAMPLKDLNIGFRFTYNFKLEAENDTTTFKGSDQLLASLAEYKDGEKDKLTEPVLFALGASYILIPGFKVEIDFTYSLDSLVDRTNEVKEENYKNRLLAGISFEYAIIQQLKASIGYLYDSGFKKAKARTEIDYGLTVHHVACGASYAFSGTVDVGIGLMYSFYREGTAVGKSLDQTGQMNTHIDQKVQQTSIDFGIGVNLKL